MQIGRFQRAADDPFWGVICADGERVRRLAGDYASWAPVLSMADEAPDAQLGEEHVLADLALRAPLAPGARIWGVGINYMKHIAGHFSEPPESIPGFIKPRSAIIDPGAVARYPVEFEQLDYEVELVLVMARPPEPGESPLEALLGYTIGNDASVRDVPRIFGPDLYSIKGQDGMSAVGPWVTTRRSVGGPRQPDLEMLTHVNGELRQQGRTSDMLFSVEQILTFVSERNALQAGDLIFTGTVSGTCYDAGHPYLVPGDDVTMAIEGIGSLGFSIGERSLPGAAHR